uniref:AB hydrolase-1 domain-containing protein n=1 Tax=Chenopodium quinoa TaxID=63459 RepID=A0A803LP69_CHEQI
MAEHYPDLVDSMVVTGSVMALSESISSKALKRIGFSSWPECLMPNSVEGVKAFLDVTSYSLPWMPNFFYKHFLEALFSNNRKERVKILEALVVKDEHVTNHQFRQADCFAKGLRKLGVEKCVVVGLSYGGFVGFQMAEHYPDLVDSMVVTGSVLALSESISSKALERIGFNSWPEYLMPNSVEGVKVLLDKASYSFPWMPKVFFKHIFEVMFGNRKERVAILEALVVKDEHVTNHQFRQRIHLLWGNDDKIFNMEVANNLKERLGAETNLQVLKKAGHLAPLERPCAFNKCLKKLLDSLAIAY